MNHLDVYLLDDKVGILTQHKGGKMGFAYDEAWLSHAHARPISLSLPLRSESFNDDESRPFFAGLLPDATVRKRLAQTLQISEKNDYALLEEQGRECAGAISLYPPDVIPSQHAAPPRIVHEQELAELIQLLANRPLLAGINDVRLSLAGAQNKMAVVIRDGQFALPRDTIQPTTHIIKPAIAGLEGSISNEFFCMRLAQKIMGKTRVPDVEWRITGGVPFLLIERYDRALKNGQTIRVHQEDFCQALAVLPDRKYQRTDHGPSLEECFGLLGKHSTRPAADRLLLLDAVIFNFLIGNADAHAKNFSFLYHEGATRLAPFYDLLCTRMYSPPLSDRMAMKIGDTYEFERAFLHEWERMALKNKLAVPYVRNQLIHFANTLPAAALALKEELLAQKLYAGVYDKIIAFIHERAAMLRP